MSTKDINDGSNKNQKNYQHFKLISEGGNYLARETTTTGGCDNTLAKYAEGKDGKCPTSIEIRRQCPNPSQVQAYQDAVTGGAMLPAESRFLFATSLEHIRELDKGIIPEALRQEFKNKGIPLSDSTRINTTYIGKIWYLTDKERKYSVRAVPTNLYVYTENR